LLIALLFYLYRFQGSSHSLSQVLCYISTASLVCQAVFSSFFAFFHHFSVFLFCLSYCVRICSHNFAFFP